MTERANIKQEDVVIPAWMKYQGPDRHSIGVSRDWQGMKVSRHFTHPDGDLWATVDWDSYNVEITDDKGEVVFVMEGARFPTCYSERARKIIAGKYMKRCNDETGHPSMRALIERIVRRITGWGDDNGYYATDADRNTHYDELCYAMLHQYFAFNSPVWFNLGIDDIAQQGSACFIVDVQDELTGPNSISDWYNTETLIFKRGSGSGADVSRLRSSREKLSLGGIASGPVSFMKTADVNAGQIKSGGTTRRAAKMVVMRVDHPDILTNKDGTPGFVRCKAAEEKRAHDLIDLGYSGKFNVPGNAYDGVYFQNANHSVRLTDEFMGAYLEDGDYWTKYVKTGRHCELLRARDVMYEIAEAAHFCGDPGVQFDDEINRWNTCPNSFWIWASNPCGEYHSRDETACNLASIRLVKLLLENGNFDYDSYYHLIDIGILAMEAIVSGSDYPTEGIAFWTRIFRNLGLGHCDLGALLMRLGIPYDSDQGRGIAAMLASTMTARAYIQSAKIAETCGGPFAEFERNREPMLHVIRKHTDLHYNASNLAAGVDPHGHQIAEKLYKDGGVFWEKAGSWGRLWGYRNANMTVEAPTGTISFLMDCDTTGVEPSIGLVTYKMLVGGGTLTMACASVDSALDALGYSKHYAPSLKQSILDYIAENGTVEGCVHLKDHHLPVFDCAFSPLPGGRTISWEGHLKMVAAMQPFISMALSKTVNLPEEADPADIQDIYAAAWKLGVKAVSIYRNNSKRSQPVSSTKLEPGKPVKVDMLTEVVALHRDEDLVRIRELEVALSDRQCAKRERMPDERPAITHKFQVGNHEAYVTVGLYPDGRPGELFITMSKEGSTASGLLDAFATSVSLNLQYGVPLGKLVEKFSYMRFEPSGWTAHEDIPQAHSIVDYIFRWMALRFPEPEESPVPAETAAPTMQYTATLHPMASRQVSSGPPCGRCHTLMVPSGKCHTCPNCGETGGCG